MSPSTSDPEYILRGVAGVVFGRQFQLLAPTTVGRAPECDICVADPGISRMHARLRPLDYGLEIEDLKSTNGTFLNGQRVALGVARVGDEIAFDQLRFRIDSVARQGQQTVAVGRPVRLRRSRAPMGWIAAAIAVAAAAAVVLLR